MFVSFCFFRPQKWWFTVPVQSIFMANLQQRDFALSYEIVLKKSPIWSSIDTVSQLWSPSHVIKCSCDLIETFSLWSLWPSQNLELQASFSRFFEVISLLTWNLFCLSLSTTKKVARKWVSSSLVMRRTEFLKLFPGALFWKFVVTLRAR